MEIIKMRIIKNNKKKLNKIFVFFVLLDSLL